MSINDDGFLSVLAYPVYLAWLCLFVGVGLWYVALILHGMTIVSTIGEYRLPPVSRSSHNSSTTQ